MLTSCVKALAPGSYEIVIDGVNGAEADYDIEMWCFDPGGGGPRRSDVE